MRVSNNNHYDIFDARCTVSGAGGLFIYDNIDVDRVCVCRFPHTKKKKLYSKYKLVRFLNVFRMSRIKMRTVCAYGH